MEFLAVYVSISFDYLMTEMIKSTSYNQGEILRNILALHVPDKRIDLDCTYSTGNFYKDTGIDKPRLRFDIAPADDSVTFGDARHLPFDDGSIRCMVFDPPFLATTGASLQASDSNNILNKCFGVYSSERELFLFYKEALAEAYRILSDGGILIFKCQDKVSSSKQYMTHCFVYEEAVRLGFYPKDLFILLAKSRLVADWQRRNQKHARKYHSYFWVLQKIHKKEPIADCLAPKDR